MFVFNEKYKKDNHEHVERKSSSQLFMIIS